MNISYEMEFLTKIKKQRSLNLCALIQNCLHFGHVVTVFWISKISADVVSIHYERRK